MAMFSQRPVLLAHVSDEQAARALSRRFGNIKKAAEDLNVDPKQLRRLTWSNPGILTAANERQSLFASARRDEIIRGLYSKAASARRRAVDRMAANPGLFGDWLQNAAFKLLAPAPRVRRPHGSDVFVEAERARRAIEGEVAAERASEREREAAAERAAERERFEVMVEGRAPSSAPTESLWPAWIRRPTRGQRR